MKNKSIFYLLITIITLLIILIFRANSTTNNKTENQTIRNNTIVNKVVKKGIYIESHKGYNYKITGIVRNNTNKKVTGLKLKVNIYDKDNNKLGSSGDMMSLLEPGETWAFSIWTGQTNYKYKNLKLTYDNE